MQQSKIIIIMGTGNSVRYCNFKADEVWGVNGTYTLPATMPPKFRKFFRQDKLFMTDTLFSHEYGTLNFDIKGMNKFAKKYNCEFIALNKLQLGKHKMIARKYPYKQVAEYFGTEYFTDTICYMIAYALYTHTHLAQSPEGVIRPELKQPLDLKLYGIDMATTREFQQSKGGVEFWLGVARGLGCNIIVAPGGTIMRPPCIVPYGQWSKLKITKKRYDPLGLLSGKDPTSADADKVAEKLGKEEAQNEKGNQQLHTQTGW